MGTNYYAITRGPCCECGQETDLELHIGKSSAGWRFVVRARPDEYTTFREWLDWVNRQEVISNEYGDRMSAPDFLARVAPDKRAHLHGDGPSLGPLDVMDRDFS